MPWQVEVNRTHILSESAWLTIDAPDALTAGLMIARMRDAQIAEQARRREERFMGTARWCIGVVERTEGG